MQKNLRRPKNQVAKNYSYNHNFTSIRQLPNALIDMSSLDAAI